MSWNANVEKDTDILNAQKQIQDWGKLDDVYILESQLCDRQCRSMYGMQQCQILKGTLQVDLHNGIVASSGVHWVCLSKHSYLLSSFEHGFSSLLLQETAGKVSSLFTVYNSIIGTNTCCIFFTSY